MRNLLPLFALLLAVSASAETLPAFQFTGAAQLRAQAGAEKLAIAEPPSRAADVITKNHLLVQAGKEVLFGYAETPEQFNEAVAYWSDVLRGAGIQPGRAELKDGIFVLPYRTADGRVLRSFLADARQFPPKDEDGLRANMALTQKALAASGLTPVSARVVNLDVLLPTYSLFYLAKPDANPDHETLLRVLKPGDDLEPALIKASGVTVVQTPETWMLVYVGPELGYVTMAAKTSEDIAAKLEKRKAFLVGEGKRIIGEKIVPMDYEDYKFAAELLFFQ